MLDILYHHVFFFCSIRTTTWDIVLFIYLANVVRNSYQCHFCRQQYIGKKPYIGRPMYICLALDTHR